MGFGSLFKKDKTYARHELLGKGTNLLASGKMEKAIKCFDKAIKSDPGFVDAWINKGYTLHHLGKHEESIVCIRKVLELDPNNEAALYNIKAFGYEEHF